LEQRGYDISKYADHTLNNAQLLYDEVAKALKNFTETSEEDVK
jgi:hypothetical protein